MSVFHMTVPDVGEGVAEAEIVEWLVAIGDTVTADSALAEVLTDKATVEIACPVVGVVSALYGEPGDMVAVGSQLVDIDIDDDDTVSDTDPTDEHEPATSAPAAGTQRPEPTAAVQPTSPVEQRSSIVVQRTSPVERRSSSDHPTAAPAVRARAQALGIDLATVVGSGPDGRVVHGDLDSILLPGSRGNAPRVAAPRVSAPHVAGWQTAAPQTTARDVTAPDVAAPDIESSSGVADRGRTEPVRGVRRRIADRVTAAWTEIPHITYIDAIDATELERLRTQLNTRGGDAGGAEDVGDDAAGGLRLTLLPFLAKAIAIACRDQPHVNARYDQAGETLTKFGTVHLGVATQTDSGLLVPVVRDVGTRSVWDLAAEIGRVTTAARDGTATREELSGSTITITSLGALGGLATTPILNAPEVAIVGVNKMETRPVWRNGTFEPRQMFNLSSSFDHRIVDGWDAATFVQRIRTLIETPALLFVDARPDDAASTTGGDRSAGSV